ncbi:MAG: Spy/CpxP family protein refolding chaperone [Candidatus Gastranaerophilales bacterium]|nr:Spy/CpxP family protein refolding chaperone [Candidatus Gastranaerophilales bacterium]
MNIKILSIIAILLINTSSVFAHNCIHNRYPQKPGYIKQRQMDKAINERLNLSSQQIDELKKNRLHHQKEMGKILENMEDKHTKIRNVYYSGIPKFQADVKTAPMKAELVILKQNADKLRQEHRKSFENILTPEQRNEFQTIIKEMHSK